MQKKIAVVLFQLGGPDSREAVEPFLFNLFMDPDIIDFPFARLARKPLAKYIATTRAKKVAHHYEQIGGKSPILEFTNAQAKALQEQLSKRVDATVFVAMRYWHPMTDAVAEKIRASNFDKVVLLPMYPQYSMTTSGSSINEWNRQCTRLGFNTIPQELIHHFYDHQKYIDAVVDNIKKGLARFPDVNSKDSVLVFSAHGVPLSVIQKGDPYQRHLEETVRLVMERGKWPNRHILCYQSKVGRAEWLKPSLHETIHALAHEGVQSLLVVPIAFVTDHIETLYEIDIEERREAEKLGIRHFVMTPALNDHPLFIEALAYEVMKRLS